MKINTNGISINGQKIHSIRFADDIVLIAESTEELNLMLNYFDIALTKFNLKININKTKVLIVSKSDQQNITNIKIRSEAVEQVKKFYYLGNLITKHNRSTKEVKRIIALAKQEFEKKRFLLANENLSIQSRKSFIKTYIWSVLLYSCETWTLKKYKMKRLKAMKMWIWRRTTRTSWTEKKRNDFILQEICEKRNIITTITKRKVKFIGLLLRHNYFVTNILVKDQEEDPDNRTSTTLSNE
jgi:hypothetical protein